MKVFEIAAPDGRRVRYVAESIEAARASLVAGYELMGEVFGADDKNAGGWLVPVGGKSLMGLLLEHHGDELLAWLRARDVSMPQRKV